MLRAYLSRTFRHYYDVLCVHLCHSNDLNNIFSYETDISLQIGICAVFATLIEYMFGLIFNQDYHIWDYRNMPFNIDGQICLPFTFLWAFIAAIIIPLMDWIDHYVFDYLPDTKPYYKLFGRVIWKMK